MGPVCGTFEQAAGRRGFAGRRRGPLDQGAEKRMELVIALMPGAMTGLVGFGASVIVAGRFWKRHIRHGWQAVATYMVVVGLLWIGCLIGGGTLFWPLLKQHGHAAAAMFLIPYVIVTPAMAGVALMKFGSDLLSRPQAERTGDRRG